MYVHEDCSMVHRNDLAQAEALVAQEPTRQARKATALQKEMMKKVKGQFSRFTKIHQEYVEYIMLLCKELSSINVHLYLKISR